MTGIAVIFRRAGLRVLALGALSLAHVAGASAQRASENAVTTAEDVFGTTVGNESIGIYNSNDVRGFSPIQAGDVRIDGLYFDKVGDSNDRIMESSRIRVGIAAQGYAFPAPTGIVDYALRAPGDVEDLSLFADGNSWGGQTLQIDGALPIDDKLSIGGGIGYYRNMSASGTSNYEGMSGMLVRWRPLPNLEILPFWSRKDTYSEKNGEAYSPNGDFLPTPMPQRHFFGPQWATSSDFSINYGALVRYTLSSWVMRLGIFRSELGEPKSSFPVLSDLALNGQGALLVDSSPPAHLGSTSGEFRLEKDFTSASWTQRLILSLRGRNWNGLYGDAVTLDAGPQAIDQYVNSPRPGVTYGPLIHDHVDERWLGFEYQVAWQDRLQISVGAQDTRYHKDTLVPGAAPVVFNEAPWLPSVSATANVTDKVAVFGDYTEGLEDNGLVPRNAVNSNQALPALTTRQTEAGVRWTLFPKTNLVATVFDLKKPYFNLDPSDVYRDLGQLENKGLEVSLSGNLTDRLDILAGGVFSEPAVNGAAVSLGVTGDRPVGIYSRKLVFGSNWQPPGLNGLSFDLDGNYYGSIPATLDDAVSAPSFTTVDWDTRYEFKLAGENTQLKFAIFNMFNVRDFRMIDADTYGIFGASGRRFDLRLIVDVS